MKTHDQVVKQLMKRRGVREEVKRVEREDADLLDALAVRGDSAQVCEGVRAKADSKGGMSNRRSQSRG